MGRCVVYSDSSVPCGFILARAFRTHRGPGRFRWGEAEDETRLIQTDWDYPGVASNLGWSPKRASREYIRSGNYRRGFVVTDRLHLECIRECDHSFTDGTVDCPGCGFDASYMIQHAGRWIRDREGQTFEDPGYFDGEKIEALASASA